MSSLDCALDRLIHDRAYRDAFIQGNWAALGLAPAEREELSTIDVQALCRLSARVARETLTRKHAGSGSLLELFPNTISAWRAARTNTDWQLALGFAFVESPAFTACREACWAAPSLPIEQAFYEFAEAQGLGTPEDREHEFLAAMIKLRLANPRASLVLPPNIHRLPGGVFALTSRSAPVLYAALAGRFIRGAVTPFLAELMLALASSGTDAVLSAVALRHGVPGRVLEQSLAQLSALGLVRDSANELT
jgi:hypothetical protein